MLIFQHITTVEQIIVIPTASPFAANIQGLMEVSSIQVLLISCTKNCGPTEILATKLRDIIITKLIFCLKPISVHKITNVLPQPHLSKVMLVVLLISDLNKIADK